MISRIVVNDVDGDLLSQICLFLFSKEKVLAQEEVEHSTVLCD